MTSYFIIAIVIVAVVAFFLKNKGSSSGSGTSSPQPMSVDQIFNAIQSQLPNLSTTQVAEVKSWIQLVWIAKGNTGLPSVDQIKNDLKL